ncbi:enoyl-CoA hydratase-related protein [Bosea sp. (in: a-proteobacteria)]|uniref:enoyl-CoA hydratase-related protein n=1 Tax=Bosea sp. (in: a-proteobacteria) TaxID=1871050 RepID=UPI00262958C1|nr:enoyl-CoA hydratase-related protein [Bosea sp. (in: a-proteobacteria)]MCO5089513.1 enoyl-CoA hydratase-related protein [Bosea sp. (in: a-proteobacteria)]
MNVAPQARAATAGGTARFVDTSGHACIGYAVGHGIGVITLNNPPVNALAVNNGMVQRLYDVFAEGSRDPEVQAFALIGNGANFCGGAEITEFGTPYAEGQADVPALLPFMDTLTKPIVAGLHGATMGGGLEIALACHYRIALAGTRLALPEVKLGILPGAGGAPRVTRLIGVERALDFLAFGEPVSAEEVLAIGLVDEVAADDIRNATLAYARRLIEAGTGIRRTSEIAVAFERQAVDVFASARRRVAKATQYSPAPLALVDCVEATAVLPFAESVKFEARVFDFLVTTPASRALRRIFFAERKAARPPQFAGNAKPARISRVAIAGADSSAADLAASFAAAGVATLIFDEDATRLEQCLAVIRESHAAALASGALSPSTVDQCMALIRTNTSPETLAEAGLVIASVPGDMASAVETFRMLDRVMKPDALLAANTASLDIGALAAATARPQAVVAMRFSGSGREAKLAEISAGETCVPETLLTAAAFCKRVGKAPVMVGTGHGLIGERMADAFRQEAFRLAEEGADPQRIDEAMRDFGFPAGPFEKAGSSGTDTGRPRSHEAVGARRAPSGPEIVERLIYRLINEGSRLLESGVARQASDIDVVQVLGYGFPRHRGGPMCLAEEVGLARVLASIREFHRDHGEAWAPAPLLVERALSGGGFDA